MERTMHNAITAVTVNSCTDLYEPLWYFCVLVIKRCIHFMGSAA